MKNKTKIFTPSQCPGSIFLIVVVLFIIQISMVSAFEFDNEKFYDEETKTVTIKNCALWLFTCWIEGETIAEIQLISPIDIHVGQGYQKVAELKLSEFNKDYTNAFSDMNFYQINEGMKEFDRSFDYKYKSEEIEQREIMGEVCEVNPINETETCDWEETGEWKNYTKEVWIKFSDVDELPDDEEITFGIFTDVLKDDYVEWIPRFFGFEIEEWASWTENLNTNLLSYWRLDESSGAIIDATGNIDGTNDGADYSQPGIIGTSMGFISANTDSIIGDSNLGITGTDPHTFNCWIFKTLSLAANQHICGFGASGSLNNAQLQINNKLLGYDTSSGTGNFNGNTSIVLSEWVMITAVYTGTKALIYMNGTLVGQKTFTHSINDGPFRLGQRAGGSFDYNGSIDEASIWSRALTPTEIEQLYNEGVGITYGQAPLNITLIAPEDNQILTRQVEFNCTSSVSPSTVSNMSLWTNKTGTWARYNTTTGLSSNYEILNPTRTYSHGEGILWNCQACDSDDNCDFAEDNRTFTIDTIAPEINITSPTNKTYTIDTVELKVTSDITANTFWYSNYTGGVSNITFTPNITIEGYPDGLNNITVWVNDTAGNENQLTVFFTMDTEAPRMNITSPTNTTYTIDTIELEVTSDGTDNIWWYSNDSGITNITFIPNITIAGYPDGLNDITVFVNDTYGNTNQSTVFFTVDTTPFIDYDTPPTQIDDYNSTTPYIPIEVTLTETYFENITFTFSNGTAYTFEDGTRDINYYFADGSYNYNVTICTTTGQCNTTINREINIDTTLPTFEFQSPNGTYEIIVMGDSVDLNITITDSNLDSCWYNYNGTNITIEGCLTGIKNSTSFLFELGDNDLIVWANDTSGNLASSITTWSYNLTEVSQTYPLTSIESSIETYTSTVNYDSSAFSVITGVLILNGTEYLGTRTGSGNDATFSTDTIMPSISTQTNFTSYWTIGLTDAGGIINYNLSSNNVTVEIINFSLCDLPLTVPFWNFTILNESNSATIDSTFEATFTVKPTGSTITKEFVFSDITGSNGEFDFCMTPSIESYTISTVIKLTKPNFVDRFYNFQEVVVTNSTREDNLYMLTSDDSTSFIVHVVDVSSTDIEEAEVRVQRFYPGTGTWVTTEILTTNYVGEAVGHLLSEDADYRFKVYQDGISIYNSSATKITCTIAPCTVTLVIPISVLTGVEVVEDLTSTLTYGSTTNVFTYTYSDTSGIFTRSRLYVFRVWPSNSTLIIACNETKTTASGVITCNIFGQVNGTYRASAYITRDGAEFLDKRLTGTLGTKIFNSIGIDGILWSFFIFIGIVMIGIARPSLAIIFGALGVIVLSLLQLINIGAISIISIVAIAIILLMRIGKE